MFQNVDDFWNKLKNFEKKRNPNLFVDYTLDKVQSVLEKCVPKQNENAIRISVVGTNGKGSVSHFLEFIGLTNPSLLPIGLYTSPHLQRVNERITVSNQEISSQEILDFIHKQPPEIQESLQSLSFFEFMTVLAIWYYTQKKCNLEIYEAGLGGRLDATKLVNPKYVVLTKIAMDHSEILGDTLEKILQEKLQIHGSNTKVLFSMEQENHLLPIIDEYCRLNNIKFYKFSYKKSNYLKHNFHYAEFILDTICKEENLGEITINPNQSIPAIKGRMEVLRKDPIVLYDVGHNPDGIFYLLNSIEELYPDDKWNITLGSLPDKDIVGILHILTNWKNTKKIYRIISPEFHDEMYEHPKLEELPISEWNLSHLQDRSLVCGGFRLYTRLQNILKGK